MTLRTNRLHAFCASALLLILLVACGGAGTTNTPVTTTNAGKAAANSAATPASNVAVLGQTGVASCDEYLTKVEKCLNNPNVPEAVRATWRTSLEQNRTAWKQAAANAQARATLETTCRQALDAAQASFAMCN
jgi:hypothetical protein